MSAPPSYTPSLSTQVVNYTLLKVAHCQIPAVIARHSCPSTTSSRSICTTFQSPNRFRLHVGPSFACFSLRACGARGMARVSITALTHSTHSDAGCEHVLAVLTLLISPPPPPPLFLSAPVRAWGSGAAAPHFSGELRRIECDKMRWLQTVAGPAG